MDYKVYPRNSEFNVLEQVLYNRGITSYEKMKEFVQPDESVIQSEYSLANIEDAAKELCRNLVHQNKIYIQVDSDTDGYTSAALLINYLYRIFPATVTNKIIYNMHDNKHHGINIGKIPDDVKLVIAPDSSSNELEIHQQLYERGIHVIVLDHHEAEIEESEPAIIVNNQICNYKNKALSGVGIVYKFCKVLDKIFHVDYADDYLDLVSLGDCADMMDLREPETHYYVLKGAENIKNIFYGKIIEKQAFSMKGQVNPFTIGWYVAPLINAVTRSGTLEEKKITFEAFLDHKAIEMVPSTKRGEKGQEELLVDQAVRLITNIKARQEKAKKDILEYIAPQIEEQQDKPVIIVQLDPPIDENLNGLIANQIMGSYNKPAFVLNKDGDSWRGSARGFASKQVSDWREFVESSGYAEYANGHSFAYGTSFSVEGLNYFKELIKEIFGNQSIKTFYNVDFSFLQSDNFDRSIFELGELQSLWGQGVQEPLVIVEKVCLSQNDIQMLGKGTLKILIKGHETTIIKFGGEEAYNDLLKSFSSPESRIYVNILGTCAVNDFNGRQTPQIKLKDYEITSVADWYF